jgi:hypothetical protein
MLFFSNILVGEAPSISAGTKERDFVRQARCTSRRQPKLASPTGFA